MVKGTLMMQVRSVLAIGVLIGPKGATELGGCRQPFERHHLANKRDFKQTTILTR